MSIRNGASGTAPQTGVPVSVQDQMDCWGRGNKTRKAV